MTIDDISLRLAGLSGGSALFLHNKITGQYINYTNKGVDLTGNNPITPLTPFRIASNTKTFTAAAILRLWEMQQLELDHSIRQYLPPNINQLLSSRHGTDQITLRHLLNHSSGMFDHADQRFIAKCLAAPQHVWTREEQLQLYIQKTVLYIAPGQQFIYSDTGYLLLGSIIETVSGLPLAKAIRTLLNFNEIGLKTAWWEILEPQPAEAFTRAKQFLGQYDVSALHPSMDLFGGGGLVMTTQQLVLFMQSLFEGHIFDNRQTLTEMLSVGQHEGAENYRLGLFANNFNGITVYSHLGFWGSAVYYSPEQQLCIAGFVDQREHRASLVQLIEQLIVE